MLRQVSKLNPSVLMSLPLKKKVIINGQYLKYEIYRKQVIYMLKTLLMSIKY